MNERNEQRAATGVQGLDDVLCGGLPRHRIYLIQGDPGVGKTTLALQFLFAGVQRGESCLYVTLSESRAELQGVAESHGWDLSGLHIYELSAADQNASSDAENTLFVSSEIELHEATHTLLKTIEELKPERVVIDSLSELRLLAQNPLRYRRQILSLKEYFVGRHCTALFLDDRTIDQSDQQLQSLAHGVLSLQSLAPEYGADRRRLRVVKLRGVRFRGGYHDYNIEHGGLVVFPRLVAAEHHSAISAEPLRSGVAELDRLLGGGVDRGSSTLVLGPAGSGKSSVVATYAVAAAASGMNVALFLFDENMNTLGRRSSALGLPLQRLVDEGRIVVRQIDPAEMSPGEFTSLVRRQVDERQVGVVVIDSLNGYLASMPEERFLTVQMHELLTFLAQRNVSTFLVMAQHGLLGTMQSPIDVSYVADTVLLLRYFEADGAVHKAISVVKKRSGAHENTIRKLSFGPGGIVVGQPLSGFRGVLTGVPQFVGGEAAPERDEPGRGK